MWSYQPHFRSHFEILANNVMKELGAASDQTECFLVGAKIPGRKNQNNVCIEPEDGKWPVELFGSLPDLIEDKVAGHRLKNMIYGDVPSMQDKPENIRRDSVRLAVEEILSSYDPKAGVQSFVGRPAPVEDYYVVSVLQVQETVFECFRPLATDYPDDYSTEFPSLVHAALSQVLDEAHDDLLRPDPGRLIRGRSRSATEIVRLAANRFMQMPSRVLSYRGTHGFDLFDCFNKISSQMYEGVKGKGRVLLVNPDAGSIDLSVRFANRVPFREPRWARKLLQMASSEMCLVADCEGILGLVTGAQSVDLKKSQEAIEIEFLDHNHWNLTFGEEVMLVSKQGIPSLRQEPVSIDSLLDTYRRLFPEVSSEGILQFKELFDAAADQGHGTTLIVAKDAQEEAERLGEQGTRVDPVKLTSGLLKHLSSIDGAILANPEGMCHAVGVILDGEAHRDCTPSRGSRYNSAVRYVGSAAMARLAVVISDDRTADVIPLLRPRTKQSDIEKFVADLECANKDNYHDSIRWLDRHRFYILSPQCDRINAALDRIGNEPRDVGEIIIIWNSFDPDPEFNESYYADEECE